MQGGCEVDVDSYMASHGSCFTVTWTIFENHLLEVGLIAKLGDRGRVLGRPLDASFGSHDS